MSYQPGDHQSYQPQSPYFPPPPPPAQPPPVRRRPVALWIGVGVLALAIVGGAIWGAIAESRPSRSDPASSTDSGAGPRQREVTTGDTKVVTASDNKSQLTVPATWKDVPADWRNELAVIQLGNVREEQYIMVISHDKADFDDFTGFEEAAIADLELGVDDADVSDPREVTIGGLPAVQYEISGKFSGFKVVFWCTVVDGKNGYYQIAGWTKPSARSANEPVIMKVIESFRELGVA